MCPEQFPSAEKILTVCTALGYVARSVCNMVNIGKQGREGNDSTQANKTIFSSYQVWQVFKYFSYNINEKKLKSKSWFKIDFLNSTVMTVNFSHIGNNGSCIPLMCCCFGLVWLWFSMRVDPKTMITINMKPCKDI